MNKILRWVCILGIFLVPVIPFVVSRSMLFPFITGKGFMFRIIVEIIFAAWLLLALRASEYRPNWNWIAKALLVFLGVVLLADIFSKYAYKSFWSNYERMEGFVLIAHLVAFYFVVASVFKTEKIWRWFWNVELLAGIAMSVYGYLQLAGKIAVDQGGVRLDATFGNATYLAIYLVFNMFVALIYFFRTNNKMWKWLYAGAFVIQAIPLYYTATRGAIGGFIGGLIVTALIVAWKERQNTTVRKVAGSLVGGVIVLILIFVAVRNTSFVQKSPVLSRFAQLSLSDIESQGRAYVWPMAVKGFTTSPKTMLIGWGQESFNYVFNQYYNPAMYNQEQWFDRTHNIVLDWLINAGVLGLLAYASIFLALLYMLWKRSSFSMLDKALLSGLMAAYVFNNMFVFDNLGSYMLFFTVISWITASQSVGAGTSPVSSTIPAGSSAPMKPTRQFSADTLNYLFSPVIILLLVACVYYVNVPAIVNAQDLIQGISNQPGGPSSNLSYLQKAFAENSFGRSETLEQLVPVTLQVISSNQATTDLRQSFYTLTDQELKAQLTRTPEDARYLLLAGSFYDRVGQYDTAIPYLQDAVKYSPGKPAMYFELANAYLGKGQADQAFQFFSKGYNLEPAAPDSQVLYAIGALYDNKPTIVQQMFNQIGTTTVVNDDRILSAYISLKNYASAEAILIMRLQANPNNYQLELELASVFASAGDKARAVQLIQDVETKNPSFKTQLDPYIQQLQGK